MLQDANSYDIQSLSVIGYTLLDLVAQGGMAEVYRALQHSLGREVAVKVMKEGDDTLAQRFLHEARLVATLNHRNVVTIFDVGQLPDGRPYLSMELLTGGDLRERARMGLAPAEIKRIIREVAEGLSVVHARGIIHRDIKPANILFRADGCAVLCDFGIAKSADIDTGLTHTGIVVGSPAYSSPEQTTARALDARSDLYSLGVVLAELLLGFNPYKAEDYASTVVNQLQMPPPQLPGVDAYWQPILDKLLAKDPSERFSSAEELLAAVDRLDQAPKPTAANLLDTTTQTPVLKEALNFVKRIPQQAKERLQTSVSKDAFVFVENIPQQIKTGRHTAKFNFSVRDISVLNIEWLKVVSFSLLFFLLGFGGWLGVQQYLEYRQIHDWLELGESRLQQDKLSAPPEDNAQYYFHQVLSFDPENVPAQDGLDKTVARYADLARAAKDKKDWAKALDYIERGLAVDGGDDALEALKKEIQTAQQADVAAPPPTRTSSGKQRRGNGFDQFIHNLFGR